MNPRRETLAVEGDAFSATRTAEGVVRGELAPSFQAMKLGPLFNISRKTFLGVLSAYKETP